MTYKTGVQSIEPNITDLANGWLKSYGLNYKQDRAEILGEYILDTGATVRATAKVFKISKSTVQKGSNKIERFCLMIV